MQARPLSYGKCSEKVLVNYIFADLTCRGVTAGWRGRRAKTTGRDPWWGREGVRAIRPTLVALGGGQPRDPPGGPRLERPRNVAVACRSLARHLPPLRSATAVGATQEHGPVLAPHRVVVAPGQLTSQPVGHKRRAGRRCAPALPGRARVQLSKDYRGQVLRAQRMRELGACQGRIGESGTQMHRTSTQIGVVPPGQALSGSAEGAVGRDGAPAAARRVGRQVCASARELVRR
jgi:hypothetical protein